MREKAFLCPRVWGTITNKYSEDINKHIQLLFLRPGAITECYKYLTLESGTRVCAVYATKVYIEDFGIKMTGFEWLKPNVYWKILEAWAWDTFEILQYRLGEDITIDEFKTLYIPMNVNPRFAQTIVNMIKLKALEGSKEMWNTEKRHWSFNWHRRASNMLEAMAIDDSSEESEQVLYAEPSKNPEAKWPGGPE